jgi:hypothetical protein
MLRLRALVLSKNLWYAMGSAYHVDDNIFNPECFRLRNLTL